MSIYKSVKSNHYNSNSLIVGLKMKLLATAEIKVSNSAIDMLCHCDIDKDYDNDTNQ